MKCYQHPMYKEGVSIFTKVVKSLKSSTVASSTRKFKSQVIDNPVRYIYLIYT